MPLPRAVLLLTLLLAGTGSLSAQQSAAVASYVAARAQVDRAIAALGGDSVLAGLVIATTFRGQQIQRHQSHRPAPPWERTPVSGEVTLDFARQRIGYQQRTEFPGGFRSHTGYVNDGRDAWLMNFVRGTRAPATGPARTFNGAWNMVRRSPHWLVLQARERAATLRSAGTSTLDGRPHDVVSFATADGRLLWLHLDRGTGLPSAFTMLNHDPFLGDVEDRIAFAGWRRAGGTMVPSVRRVSRAGEVIEEVQEETTVNAPVADSVFAVRTALVLDTVVVTPRRSELRPLAPGVHLLVAVQGQNALVVEFADHLAVIEPYGDDGASRTAMATIAAALPGKPIRYIVATHHHDDHAGGVRAYLAAGATLVTTDANRDHFVRFARGRGSLPPDAAEVAGTTRLETFTGRKVLADGTRRLELIDIGPNPHTEEMLVAWLPSEGVMFQGDLLNAPWDGSPFPGNETSAYFSEWLGRAGLAPRTIAAVHGPPQTVDELRAAVTRFQERAAR
ncbi:MAG TPA: MBL fold metallo-hydrolase [Gemmatimonadales bacterium]|nr:MBL fold metallo-hydrolase [Gemmatimonadales bacterium]